MSVVADEKLRSELRAMALEAQFNLVADRGLLIEAQVLEILAELIAGSERPWSPSLTSWPGSSTATPTNMTGRLRIVGSGASCKASQHPDVQDHGVYVVPIQERSKIELLAGGTTSASKLNLTRSGDKGTWGLRRAYRKGTPTFMPS